MFVVVVVVTVVSYEDYRTNALILYPPTSVCLFTIPTHTVQQLEAVLSEKALIKPLNPLGLQSYVSIKLYCNNKYSSVLNIQNITVTTLQPLLP